MNYQAKGLCAAKLLIFCLLIGSQGTLGGVLYAQKSRVHRYSVKQGLPSSHTYCVALDTKGNIWAGTESGVVRFDGFTFNSYNQTAGLPQNDVFFIVDDQQGNIWLNSLNYWTAIQEKKVVSSLNSKHAILNRIFNLKVLDDAIYLTLKGFPFYQVWKYSDGNWTRYHLNNYPELRKNRINQVTKLNGEVWALAKSGVYALEGKVRKVAFKGGFLSENNLINTPAGVLLTDEFHHLLIFQGDSIYALHPGCVSGQAIDRILAIYLDSKDMVWLSSAGQGVYRYQIADLLAGKPTVEHYLDEEEVNGIVEDLEGNMWFSTLRGGLCMKPAASFLIQYADQTSGLAGQSVEDIAIQQDGRIFLAHQNNRITQMKGGLVEKEIVVSKTCRTCGIRSLSALPNGNLLVCANKHIYMLNESGKVKSWVKESPKFIRLQDGDLWIGNYSSLQRVSLSAIEHTEMQKIGGELVAEIRSYISWFDRDKQRVYVGSNDGLWLVDLESGEIHRHANKLLWGKIFAIEGDEKGRIWVATDGAGVVVLDRDKCYQMGKKEGLNSNICRRICLDKNGGVWMGTQSGVNYLAPEMDLSQPVIRSVGENEGLPSNEIRALAAYENEMLIGTTDGLARMPLDYFERVKAPRLQAEITALKIAGRDTAIFSVYELGHAQSEIEIQFTALHLQARGKVDFRYRMVGLGDGNWTETGERMVQYRSVPPGNYYFEVQAKVNGASWGLPTGFSLRIAPPFTQTAWFWSLCVLGSLLLATALAAGRGRQVRRREQQKNVLQKQINDLKLKALRAQMNPHFIFNSLAAIQHFITSHNDQAAHKYLSTFSRLIRLVLENSRLELISLKEEEKVLRLYLELEHLRFRDRFSYEIMMDKSLNPNQIQVPPMLIQPFIENAVRHGLRHKSEPGKLWVHFSQHGSQFCCEVKDNGIGREASARIQQGRFRPAPSRGMEITGQRIDSLLNLSQGAAKIEIEDLIGPEGQAQGTLVRILLPVIPK